MPHVSKIKSNFFAFKRDVAATSKLSVNALKTSYSRFTASNGPGQRIKQFFQRKARPKANAKAACTAASASSFEAVTHAKAPQPKPAPVALASPKRKPVLKAQPLAQTAAPGDLRRVSAYKTASDAVMGQKFKRGARNITRTTKIRISDVVTKDGTEFSLSQTLGNGSYGKFRLAVGTDKNGQEKVWAVKEFRSELFIPKVKRDSRGHLIYPKTDITSISDIRREVKMGYAVKSPVRIERLINIDGKILALMPYMDGGDGLDLLTNNQGRLQRSGTDRAAIALGLLQSMGQQLANMHKNGFMHGDIKPQNLLFDRKGQFAVADFGGMSHLNKQGVTVGNTFTANYLSPERLENCQMPHTAAPDMFAVGVTILDVYAAAFGQSDSGFGTPRAMLRFDRLRYDFLEAKRGRQTATLNESRNSPMGATFGLMARDMPELADFMLEHVLNTEPTERATPEQAYHFASQHMSQAYKDRLFDMMQGDLGHATRNDRVLDLLHNYRADKANARRKVVAEYSYF